MAQINKLPPVDTPAVGDLLPFWSQQNGRACSTSIYQLAQLVLTMITNNGSAGIIPESGPTPIKISAFADAEFPINPNGTATGLLSGFNRNYTQFQLLSGKDALVDGQGTDVAGKAGDGFGVNDDPESPGYGRGGNYSLAGGGSSVRGGDVFYIGGPGLNNGHGGFAVIAGGTAAGSGDGGAVYITGARSETGRGGDINIASGYTGVGKGGDINIVAQFGGVDNADGNIKMTLTGAGGETGNLFLYNLPQADPVGKNFAIWFDPADNILRISRH